MPTSISNAASKSPPFPSRRSAVVARNMVAASQTLAVKAGLRMFYMGGDAVDVDLATAITLTPFEPKRCLRLMMLDRVCLTALPQNSQKSFFEEK